jgi:hypothetical protein
MLLKITMKKDKLLIHVIKKSKEKPLDIFELNDGRVVVNGNVFENRAEFDKILKIARQQIKISNFFKKLMFWKK